MDLQTVVVKNPTLPFSSGKGCIKLAETARTGQEVLPATEWRPGGGWPAPIARPAEFCF
jgi:hypothetical protein